jgi:hypothetical protein
VVHREFFVNEVFFYGIEVGTLALVLQDLHVSWMGPNGCEFSKACLA